MKSNHTKICMVNPPVVDWDLATKSATGLSSWMDWGGDLQDELEILDGLVSMIHGKNKNKKEENVVEI